eukprot:TRINITY_DN19857_c0_g3_i1.p1 TRINITY_DN19857_c0_g3~~TRINITY_DN19857_c0_g3_i1.p1  ORF type:complete len:139 (+),score=58.15 TRINITY_DN19857_c0_g3_i1:54-470(+)
MDALAWKVLIFWLVLQVLVIIDWFWPRPQPATTGRRPSIWRPGKGQPTEIIVCYREVMTTFTEEHWELRWGKYEKHAFKSEQSPTGYMLRIVFVVPEDFEIVHHQLKKIRRDVPYDKNNKRIEGTLSEWQQRLPSMMP